jgi:hypothetical protein
MANVRKNRHPIEKLVNDVEFKQRNTTWPDAMVNASRVDEILFKGCRHITKVQRMGVAILGLAFVSCGILFIGDLGLLSDSRWLAVLFGTGCLLLGFKFLWNSIRKNISKKSRKNE